MALRLHITGLGQGVGFRESMRRQAAATGVSGWVRNRSDGSVHVTATDQGDVIEFSIQDDGPGIAPQFHKRIFQMFQTLKPRDQVEGSGMGLALVKKVVEARGGTIRIESSEGRGATFWFTWAKEA